MKRLFSTLPAEQARAELRQSTLYALPGVVIGFFLLSWLGIFGLIFGARAYMLTLHEGNKGRYLWLYRIGNCLMALLGIFEVTWFFTHL